LPAYCSTRSKHGRRTELRTGLDFYRYIEYPRVMEWLNRIRPKRTLDIGSNYGLVWQWSAARGIETHATDICDITLTDARAAAPQRVRDRSPISMHNATRLGFKPRSFDAVTVISTIEHIENDRAALDEIASVLEPGGYAILTFPVNREFLEIRDNPSFPLIRLYDLDAIETRLLANDQLVNEHIELWCIRDRFAAKPLWTLTRLSDVLRRFVYYCRPKPPFSPEKITPTIFSAIISACSFSAELSDINTVSACPVLLAVLADDFAAAMW